jgi:hypothetical protein
MRCEDGMVLVGAWWGERGLMSWGGFDVDRFGLEGCAKRAL